MMQFYLPDEDWLVWSWAGYNRSSHATHHPSMRRDYLERRVFPAVDATMVKAFEQAFGSLSAIGDHATFVDVHHHWPGDWIRCCHFY